MKVWGVAGWKNAGKTTLVASLVEEFTARGLVVSTLKHAHHAFDIDQPGTDSHRHRVAGAREVMLSSARRWAVMHELPEEADEPPIESLLARMSPVDLVLVEGFKAASLPKIEVIGGGPGGPLLADRYPLVRALAADMPQDSDLPRFARDDIGGIAGFISEELGV